MAHTAIQDFLCCCCCLDMTLSACVHRADPWAEGLQRPGQPCINITWYGQTHTQSRQHSCLPLAQQASRCWSLGGESVPGPCEVCVPACGLLGTCMATLTLTCAMLSRSVRFNCSSCTQTCYRLQPCQIRLTPCLRTLGASTGTRCWQLAGSRMMAGLATVVGCRGLGRQQRGCSRSHHAGHYSTLHDLVRVVALLQLLQGDRPPEFMDEGSLSPLDFPRQLEGSCVSVHGVVRV
jgi:hypothetical protein